MAGNGWTWLEMAGTAGYGWKPLGMARFGWNGRKWLEMTVWGIKGGGLWDRGLGV